MIFFSFSLDEVSSFLFLLMEKETTCLPAGRKDAVPLIAIPPTAGLFSRLVFLQF